MRFFAFRGGSSVNRKPIVACLTLILFTAAGGVFVYARYPLPLRHAQVPVGKEAEYVRIELPPIEVVEADQLTDRDSAVLLTEAAKTAEAPEAAAPEPELVATTDEDAATLDDIPSERPAPAATGQAGVIAVSFDLAQAKDASSATLELRKGVRFNGAELGQATIRVGNGASLFIASADLRTLLSAAQRADLAERLSASAEQPFVGFDEVRQQGLNLRYDAAADQILISG